MYEIIEYRMGSIKLGVNFIFDFRKKFRANYALKKALNNIIL